MNLLVDSHAILWFLSGAVKLRKEARRAIETAERAYVSAASVWELTVKHERGRLIAPDDLIDRLHDGGFLELALGWEHARVAGRLPTIHRDPFDRMLVAQAIVERLTIVSRDETLSRYDVPIIVA